MESGPYYPSLASQVSRVSTLTENGRMITAQLCPRCGAPVPQRAGRGRPRRWCSDRCRSQATSAAAAARARAQPSEPYDPAPVDL